MSHRNTRRRTWILTLTMVIGLALTMGIGFGCKKETSTVGVRRAGPAWVSIKTSPWSEVYLDGSRVGRSPVKRYRINAGEHTVTVRCGPCKVKQEKSVDFTVEPGGTYVNTDITFDVNKTSIK